MLLSLADMDSQASSFGCTSPGMWMTCTCLMGAHKPAGVADQLF